MKKRMEEWPEGELGSLQTLLFIINPLIHGIFKVFQSMAGGLWCHPQKDDI